MTSGVDK